MLSVPRSRATASSPNLKGLLITSQDADDEAADRGRRGRRRLCLMGIGGWMLLTGLYFLVFGWEPHKPDGAGRQQPHAGSHAGSSAESGRDAYARKGMDGRGGKQISVRLIDEHAPAEQVCPLLYQRLAMEQIRAGRAVPYLMGGQQQPKCNNCRALRDPETGTEWGDFCQFRHEGRPYCDNWLKKQLLTTYITRKFDAFLTLTPCDLWKYIQSRTVWVAGDSQSFDFAKALWCFLYEFWDLNTVDLGARTPHLVPLLERLTHSECAHFMEGTRVCYLRADTGAKMADVALPLVRMLGDCNDILVMNYGLHFTDNYEDELVRLTTYYTAHKTDMPFLVWHNTPPQHFATIFGEYPRDGGKPPFKCAQVGPDNKIVLQDDHSLLVNDPAYTEVAEGGWRNKVATPIMQAAGIPVIASWNETLAMWQYHRDNGAGLECTHYCFPSAPQLWVYYLFETLQEYTSEMNEHFRAPTLLPREFE